MPYRLLAGLIVVLSVAWLASPIAVQAQKPQRPFAKVVEEWTSALDRTEQEIAGRELNAARVKALKARLLKLDAEAREVKALAAAELAPLQSQLDALGLPPAEGESEETAEIAAQRQKIVDNIAFYESRIKQADLALARLKKMGESISAQRIRHSIERFATLYPFPLDPGTIAVAVPDFVKLLGRLGRSPADWWHSLSEEQQEQVLFRHLAMSVSLAILLGWAIRWALLRWLGRDPSIESPSYARRLTGAMADGLAYGIVPALILAAFLARAMSDRALISGLFSTVFISLCSVTIMFVLAWALPRAVLAPELPTWRLFSVSPENARTLSRRITLLAGVFAVDLFFLLSTRSLVLSDELISLYMLITKSTEGAIILSLMPSQLWTSQPEGIETAGPKGRRLFSIWRQVQRVITLIAIAGILSAFIGYANLSRYLIENVVLSGMAVGILMLLRGLVRELIGVILRSGLFQTTLGIPHKKRNRYKFWLRVALDLLAIAVGTAATLVIWGVSPQELLRWIFRAFEEFTIGNVTISLTDIVVAIGVFVVAMVLTRMAQRVLADHVFPQTELDIGVRHSLSAGLGYAGLALAIALAIAAVGLDLSNVALIAGALSVGIGFGLQNVVNNFVSGLILLIERPVKVGDWINVGGYEGFVKRINVRATEIETFQRASVIVPNSELISGAVTNRTHKDRHGRIDVPVGVAYGSDVPRVMEILQHCMKDHADVLAYPEPFVLFQGFGDSSLDFEARCFIPTVERMYVVASDLRVAINQAFTEAGIEIPFPQRDLHVKSLGPLEGQVPKPS